jgi:hypothetical protein
MNETGLTDGSGPIHSHSYPAAGWANAYFRAEPEIQHLELNDGKET